MGETTLNVKPCMVLVTPTDVESEADIVLAHLNGCGPWKTASAASDLLSSHKVGVLIALPRSSGRPAPLVEGVALRLVDVSEILAIVTPPPPAATPDKGDQATAEPSGGADDGL